MDAPSLYRVTTYIDGFNLYHGMRQSRLRRFYWLDVQHLSEQLLRKDQELNSVKYFTARISGDRGKQERQTAYIEALTTLPKVEIRYGNYQTEPVRCGRCHHNWVVPKEKQTDVAIATAMLTDAFAHNCDTMLLISGDSDLIPPIRAVRQLRPHIRIIVVFPPNRFNHQLKQTAHGFIHISNSHLSASLLPEVVTRADGFKLYCPGYWRH